MLAEILYSLLAWNDAFLSINYFKYLIYPQTKPHPNDPPHTEQSVQENY
jgi:hypothetical protein